MCLFNASQFPHCQMDLPADYAVVIDAWKEAWGRLRDHVPISETNKIHIVNSHLKVNHHRM